MATQTGRLARCEKCGVEFGRKMIGRQCTECGGSVIDPRPDLAEAERKRSWKPFSSAPLDERAEILVCGEDTRVLAAIRIDDCWFAASGEDLTGYLLTHWMAMPEPPAQAESEGEPCFVCGRPTGGCCTVPAEADRSDSAVLRAVAHRRALESQRAWRAETRARTLAAALEELMEAAGRYYKVAPEEGDYALLVLSLSGSARPGHARLIEAYNAARERLRAALAKCREVRK